MDINNKMEMKYVNSGIANCFQDGNDEWIELNKALKNYPELHDGILAHEKKHFKSNKKIDFKEEIREMFKPYNSQLMKFVLKNPSALTQISPIMLRKGKIAFDWFMILFYGTIITLVVI